MNLVARKEQINRHLILLDEFLAGPIYAAWESDRKASLAEREAAILDLDPKTQDESNEQFRLRGERRFLQSIESHFQNDRAILKQELDDIDAELERQSTTTETEN